MAAQQENFARMQESNFFFLSTLTSRRDGEVVQAERSRILTDALKDTTMVRLQKEFAFSPSFFGGTKIPSQFILTALFIFFLRH